MNVSSGAVLLVAIELPDEGVLVGDPDVLLQDRLAAGKPQLVRDRRPRHLPCKLRVRVAPLWREQSLLRHRHRLCELVHLRVRRRDLDRQVLQLALLRLIEWLCVCDVVAEVFQPALQALRRPLGCLHLISLIPERFEGLLRFRHLVPPLFERGTLLLAASK